MLALIDQSHKAHINVERLENVPLLWNKIGYKSYFARSWHAFGMPSGRRLQSRRSP